MKKSWLIDSNVLVYSYDETVNQHDLSYYIVAKAMSGEISACRGKFLKTVEMIG